MISKTKLVTAGAAAALFATSAVPALANWEGHNRRGGGELNLTQTNGAFVLNNVETEAETGDNSAGSGRISTGNAYADSLVSTSANSNSARLNVDCGCYDKVNVRQGNLALVMNDVETEADTGDNNVSGEGEKRHHHHSSGGSVIRTGNATAISTVGTIVNSNVAVVN